MNTDAQRCYEKLGLEPGADQDQIKKAWRGLANQWHPDKVSHNPKLQSIAQEEMKSINAAYEFLKLHPQTSQADTEMQQTKSQSKDANSPPQAAHQGPTLRPILRPAPKGTRSKNFLPAICGFIGSVLLIEVFTDISQYGFPTKSDIATPLLLFCGVGLGIGGLAYAFFGGKER